MIGCVQSALLTSVAWYGPGSKSSSLRQLHLDALDVVAQRVVVEQVALLAAPARVADHAGGAAGQRERAVAGELEAAHEQLADEVTDVQRVGRRIEPDVQADVALGQPRRECVAIGGVVDEPAGVEFGEQIHSGSPCCQVQASIHSRDSVELVADHAELSRRFRAFAETASRRAPLYSVLAGVVADDPALVGLLEAAPEEQHNPVLLFVAVHDLLLRGLGPDLAAFYPNLAPEPKTGDVASVFRSFVSNHADQIRELVATRSNADERGRSLLAVPPAARPGL